MKKQFFYVAALGFTLLASAGLYSCKKSLDNLNPHIPAAGLLTFNLSPDKTVGVSVSGNNLLNFLLYFNDYSGAYQAVYAGARDVTTYDYYTREALATTSANFADSAYYSLFAVGVNGNYKNILVKDNLDSLPTATGQAFIRYINAVPDSASNPAVAIAANGASIFNDTPAFTTVSAFKGLTPGAVSITVNNTENAISASRTITLEQNKIYTVLITGLPNQSDTSKAVHIRYITNGAIVN
jgi:hypothetical protein